MPAIGDQVGLTLDQIVFATDFSPSAEKAAGYAQGLAKRFYSSLSLAHVIDLSVATRSEEAVVGVPIDKMRRVSAENMERLLNDMTSTGVRTTAHTQESDMPAFSHRWLCQGNSCRPDRHRYERTSRTQQGYSWLMCRGDHQARKLSGLDDRTEC